MNFNPRAGKATSFMLMVAGGVLMASTVMAQVRPSAPVVLIAPSAKPPLTAPFVLSKTALTAITDYLALDLDNLFQYATPNLPAYYTNTAAANTAPAPPFGAADNTPPGDRITNSAATLGRVLFNDKRLSINNSISCASCHQQEAGFTDIRRFSAGAIPNTVGTAHAMRLGNVSFYKPGSMFWDKRAASVELQSTQPIQNLNEMGFDASHGGINAFIVKMQTLPYYPALFQWVYGTPAITEPKIQQALAQYERSMVSVGSRWDAGFAKVFNPLAADKGVSLDIAGFTPQENVGRRLFMLGPQQGGLACAGCHVPPTFALNGNSLSNGLDAGATTIFKAPSLKNVGVGKAFMHDGRFATLEQVVDHYDHGVKAGPSLDNRLKNPAGQPRTLNLSVTDKAALVAFMKTLTDTALLSDAKYSNPFIK